MTKTAQNGKCRKDAQAERDAEHEANIAYLKEFFRKGFEELDKRGYEPGEISEAEHKANIEFLKAFFTGKLKVEPVVDPIDEIKNRPFSEYFLDVFLPPYMLELRRVNNGAAGLRQDAMNIGKCFDKAIGRFRDEAGI